MHYNAETGKEYSARNQMLLAKAGQSEPVWAGFNQWLNLGRAVRKGEKASYVLMIKTKKVITNGVEEIKTFPSQVAVFNISQVDALPGKEVKAIAARVDMSEVLNQLIAA